MINGTVTVLAHAGYVIHDAVADLGDPEKIGHLFASFQKYLYQQSAPGFASSL